MKLQKGDFNVFRAGYAEQVEKGFRPRRDTKPLRLKLPLDWDMDPFKDRNWRFQLHAWRMLQPIWSEFHGRDWDRLKREVLPWIRDWYRHHVQQRRKSEFMWYDMAAGVRAQHLALIIHLQQRGLVELDGEEQAEIDELAALHIAKLRDPSFISKGNHGIFQLVGLRLLGIVWQGRPETEGEEAYSSEQMRALIESQFGPEGVHVENSPDYHNFAVTHFGRIRPELFPSIAGVFARKLGEARDVAPWFTRPDGSIAAIGDSEGTGVRFVDSAAADAGSSSVWGDRVVMRDLSKGGYVTVRTTTEAPAHRSEMLVIKGQAATMSHAHADHLGFELFAHGRPLFVDAGKFTYNKNKWRSFFTSDRAHNVVGLHGRAFGPYDTVLGDSGLTAAGLAGGEYFAEGRVRRGDGFSHRRRFEYRPGQQLVLHDAIEAPDAERAVVYFHLDPHVDAEPSDEGVAILVGGRKVATLAYPADEFSLRLVRGQDESDIQGWISPGYGAKEPAVAIELTATGSTRSWTTAIHLTEPVLPNDLLQRQLPREVRIPFLYSCRSDRVLPRPEGATERRVLLEFYSGSPDSANDLLSEALERGGFQPQRSRPEQGGVRTYYVASDGSRGSTLVRPASTYPVRTVGAVGSIYMSFVESIQEAVP